MGGVKNADLEHCELLSSRHNSWAVLRVRSIFSPDKSYFIKAAVRLLTLLHISTHHQVLALHVRRDFLRTISAAPPRVLSGSCH